MAGFPTYPTLRTYYPAAVSGGGSVTVRKNTGADIGTRPRLNLIEGTNITLTVADDGVGNEVDITIAAAGISDGDKGDITVSGSGTVWNIDASAVGTTEIANDAVTYDKIQNVTADNRLLGRAGSVGNVEEITVGAPLTLGSGALDFDETAALGNVARTTVRKNTGADVGSRRRLNFIEGSNITLTIADDAANEEVDITIDSAGGGSGLTQAQVLARLSYGS